MYTAFYGLEEKPFTLSPDPKYLFLSETHREVLGHLIYGIEQGEGFIAISGEVGTGKTTLCRTLLERLGTESEVAFLFNPHLAPSELLKAINAEFGIPSGSDSLTELTQELNDFLVRKNAEGRRALLIVDEAQTLSTETLEQVRLLSNLETSRSKLLQIVLLGQPELEQKLGMRELRQLRQRITVWWQLGPMTATETREYALHRLRIAGASRPLFSDAALAIVHRVSRGIPRVINVVCDRALLAGYGENLTRIERGLVEQVAREIGPATTVTATHRRLALAGRLAALLAVLVVAFGAGMLLRGRYDPSDAPVDSGPSRATRATPAPAAMVPGPAAERIPAPAGRTERPAVGAPGSTPRQTALATERGVRPPRIPNAAPPGLRSDVLANLLDLQAPAATTAAAVDAALAAWNLPGTGLDSLYMVDALSLFQERGLATLWVEHAGTDGLSRLDLPTLVRLGRPGVPIRWALLRRIGPDHVDLEGLVPGETARVPTGSFADYWTGEGYVIWRDFEPLPRVLTPGQTGPPVAWLQGALIQLGFLGENVPGTFDGPTSDAVRAFQRAAALPADGLVGPHTKIRIYNALPSYVSPRLLPSGLDLARRP